MARAIVHEPMPFLGPPPPGMNGTGGYKQNANGFPDVTMAVVFVGSDVFGTVDRSEITVNMPDTQTLQQFDLAVKQAVLAAAADLGYTITRLVRLFTPTQISLP